MKKLLVIVTALSLMLAGCETEKAVESNSKEVSSTTISEEATESNESVDPRTDLYYRVKCVESSLHGNKMAYDVGLYNASTYYVDGLVEFIFSDSESDQKYIYGLPVENLASDDYDSGLIWLPIGVYDEELNNVEVKEVRMDFSDELITSPEITEDNIKQYIYTNFEIGTIYNNQYTITAKIHNCTLSYFTGSVTAYVYDQDGEVVTSETKLLKNLDPGSDGVIILMADIHDSYTFDVEIGDFEFASKPKA